VAGARQDACPNFRVMLYLCIPVHNEASTVGLLLWRIRKVFQQYSREYEIVVCNDGSTDSTGEVLAGYTEVLPLTVVSNPKSKGYAHALESCCREANQRSRYPRRDAVIVLQGDFTDAPEHVPELVRRFEGGADVVTAERGPAREMPAGSRWLRQMGRWMLGARGRALGTSDPLSGFRLFRMAVIRDLLRNAGDKPLLRNSGAAANLELLLAASRVARRMESVATSPRYDLQQRPSRLRVVAQALAVFRLARVAARTPAVSR
jgi:glycosyltransferase involved in cell wall biosynthesis